MAQIPAPPSQVGRAAHDIGLELPPKESASPSGAVPLDDGDHAATEASEAQHRAKARISRQPSLEDCAAGAPATTLFHATRQRP